MDQDLVFNQLYANEFVDAYQQYQSYLRGTTTTEGEVKGQTFNFILANDASPAVKRGANGDIPVAQYGQTSTSLTLEEWHHLVEMNNLNIYMSSVPQRLQMQKDGVTAINQRTDTLIFDQLETATVTWGAATVPTLSKCLLACSTLWAAKVPRDGETYGILSPNGWAHMMKIEQFASSDYVDDRPFMKMADMRNWMGVKWMMHTDVPAVGLATAKGFLYHKSALGHGLNHGEYHCKVGYEDKHDRSWTRCTSYQQAKLLKNAGIVVLNLDDTTAP